MKRSFVFGVLVSIVLGLGACSKEEPAGTADTANTAGTAEQMGKKIDEATTSMQKQASEAMDATQEQAAQAKAALGTAMEEKGKELQGDGEKPAH